MSWRHSWLPHTLISAVLFLSSQEFIWHFLFPRRVTTSEWPKALARCRADLWGWEDILGHHRALSQTCHSTRSCECKMLSLSLPNQHGVCFCTKYNICELLSLTTLMKEWPMSLERAWPEDSAQLGYDPTLNLSPISYPFAFLGLNYLINKIGIEALVSITGKCSALKWASMQRVYHSF